MVKECCHECGLGGIFQMNHSYINVHVRAQVFTSRSVPIHLRSVTIFCMSRNRGRKTQRSDSFRDTHIHSETQQGVHYHHHVHSLHIPFEAFIRLQDHKHTEEKVMQPGASPGMRRRTSHTHTQDKHSRVHTHELHKRQQIRGSGRALGCSLEGRVEPRV